MKNLFCELIIPCLKIFVYSFFLIMFLAVLGKYIIINILVLIIVATLFVFEIINVKNYFTRKNFYFVESEFGKVSISSFLIHQLIQNVVSNIENVSIEKIDVSINDNIINIELLLNIVQGISFYGAAHNIELAVKKETKDLFGYDKEIKFNFNIDKLLV
jgi:hypothetical protein